MNRCDRMILKDLTLKSSYESGVDDLIQDFYVPVLSCAVSYSRIAGFFSSSSLAIAAEGIAGMIKNGGHMRLLASPRLSEQDCREIHNVVKNPEQYLSDILLNEISDIKSEFERDHVKALGWMLAKGLLEIRLVNVAFSDSSKLSKALFHEKIGIVYDNNNNIVTFSGSINESATGWAHNVEEFKVFKSWKEGHLEFIESDINKFEGYWSGKRKNVCVYNLPEAVNQNLIESSHDFSFDEFCMKYYIKKKNTIMERQKVYFNIDERLSLFPYQKDAVDMWKSNQYQLLFEMATGTGKTRTAIACVYYLMTQLTSLVVIIACPQSTLSKQWKQEIDKIGLLFEQAIIADGTNRNWRKYLKFELDKIDIGYSHSLVIYTTHATASSKDFIKIFTDVSSDVPICFVGDEAHGLGAHKTQLALLEKYKCRIGLSATPERWFDDVGTDLLKEYFGNKSFRFTIKQALSTINPYTHKTFLVYYYYHPIFISLTDDEIEEYKKLSSKVSKLSKYKEKRDSYQNIFEKLLFKRANILKNAENKFPVFEDMLRNAHDLKNTLIFVSDSQIDCVMMILKKYGIFAHRFTQKQGTKAEKKYNNLSERQYLINLFKDEMLKVLVAISCLDEGIDIPTADTAFILSSSTNPREYIQRIGRVIRQAPHKGQAHIFDFIVEPDFERLNDENLCNFEKRVFEKELIRVEDMAQNALNNSEVQELIDYRRMMVINYGSKQRNS